MPKEGTDIGWYQIFLLVLFGFALGFIMPKPVEQQEVEVLLQVSAEIAEEVDIAGSPVDETE